jgi:hypothetical protein
MYLIYGSSKIPFAIFKIQHDSLIFKQANTEGITNPKDIEMPKEFDKDCEVFKRGNL